MDLMSGQIVHDDDVAGPQLGTSACSTLGEKGLAVHRAVEDHGRSDAVVTQPGSKGGGFPMAMWYGGTASLAPGRTTIKTRHLGVRGGLVDEDDPRRIEVELPFKPRLTRRVHRVAALFGGVRRLFFARDLATLEEPPECADGDGDAALLGSCSSANVMSLLAATAERISSACASIRCEWRSPPWRVGLTLPSRRSMARARRTDAKPLSRRLTRQPALNRANDTST
jgi:hypothetical protein